MSMTSRLERFRKNKDAYFASGEHSPLSEADRATFTGLDYFPENPDLRFTLELDTSGADVGEHIQMLRSDGTSGAFIRAGRIHFPVDGREVSLTVYRDVDRGRFFLPFMDATTGDSTYEAGRYLDPQQLPDGRLEVDFNMAYNPYCAYGPGWACPIPPLENRLDVPIEAGEKRFVTEWQEA